MINRNKIINNIQQKITEQTYMLEFQVDVNNTPSFMIAPFCEQWIWSENVNDLLEYLFGIMIPEYLINVLLIYYSDLVTKDEYSFLEAVLLLQESGHLKTIEMQKALDKLIKRYYEYRAREYSYLDFIKMIIELEKILEKLDIFFQGICYANPYETRFSRSLRTEQFDYNNLNNNFS